MSEKKYVTWQEVDEACVWMHEGIITTMGGTKPDCVVALTRGGLVPGTIISHLMNIPLVPVSYTSSVGNGSKTMYSDMELQPISGIHTDYSNYRILVVDEICDSGHTLFEVVKFYESMGYDVVTATIHHKTGAVITPDVFHTVISDEDQWIVYPWEASDDS